MIFFILSYISLDQAKNPFIKPGLTLLPKKKSLSLGHSQWYFIHFTSEKDINLIKSRLPNIKITSLSFYQNYVTLFLTPSEAHLLNSLDKLQVYYRLPKKSVLQTLPKNETFIIQAHSSFNAPRFSKVISQKGPFYFLKTNQPSLVESDPTVLSINRLPRLHTMNRWTTGFLQSGDEQLVTKNGFYAIKRKYNDKNLTGNNVIVTLIDTGADMNNCLLRDPNYEAPFNYTNINHRKVVRYDPFVDSTDRYAGHGTHCAGIIAGAANSSPMDLYNGHAPGAKLYVADVGEDEEDNVNVDLSPFFEIVEQSRKLGSPIISCSWGSNLSVPELTSIFDYLSYEDPTQLYVFAAGNDGNLYSVGSPSDSKNVLTVAASYPVQPFFLGYYPYNYVQLKGKDDQVLNTSSQNAFEAMTKYQLNYFDNIEVVNFDESADDSYDLYLKKAVVIPEGKSDLTSVFDLLVSYNAKVAIVFDNVNATHDNIIVLSAPSENKTFFETHNVVNLSIHTTRGTNNATVAPFSSLGPSYNGNRKPDVMAPGFYISSAGKQPFPDECDYKTSILEMSGTSMATPAVSGSLALVYQYLNEAVHKLPMDESKKITSPLLRAFAIAASGDTSDNVAGFGNINLSRILIYPGEDEGIGLRFRSDELRKNEHVTFVVKTDSDGPLSISLAWIDIPLSSDSVVPLFVYVDLFVIGPDGEVVDSEEQFATTRKIVINNAKAGTYEIRMRSNPIHSIQENIYYGLVVVGRFEHLNFELNPSELHPYIRTNCPSKCTSECNTITASCICDKLHTGTFCEDKIESVKEDTQVSHRLVNREFWYIRFDLSEYASKSKKELDNLAVFIESKINGFAPGLVRFFVNSDNYARLSIPRYLIALQYEKEAAFKVPLLDLIEDENLYLTAYNDMYANITIDLKWRVRDVRSVFSQVTQSKIFQIVMITLIVLLSISIVVSLVVLIVWLVKSRKKKRHHKKHNDDQNATEDMKVALVDDAQEV